MASGDQCGASGSYRKEHGVLARYTPPCGTFGSQIRRLELGLVEEGGMEGAGPHCKKPHHHPAHSASRS